MVERRVQGESDAVLWSLDMNRAALILLLVLSAAVSVAAQKVRAEADPNVDLSRYKTYSWSQGMAGANALVNAQIVMEVDRALAAKGLQKVETDPELTLAAWVWTESDTHVTNPSWAPASDTLSHAPSGNKAVDAKNAQKPIKKAVEKMFKKFPRP
jgi:hypothetical protein